MINEDLDLEKLKECLEIIEVNQEMGPSNRWTTRDFDVLSDAILKATGTHLSVATLKRLWGRVKYDSKPTITTLNTLAVFVGFRSWSLFLENESGITGVKPAPQVKIPFDEVKGRVRLTWLASVLIILLIFSAVLFYNHSFREQEIDKSPYSFRVKKLVDIGVPNSVLFEYDVSSAPSESRAHIQQNWDKNRRKEVPKHAKLHQSVYYYPGFFRAKLIVDQEIVREADIFIKTKGWLAIIEQEEVPVYFESESTYINDGKMNLSQAQVIDQNIPLTPKAPWISLMRVGDFKGITSDDFSFQTEIRNTLASGANPCQHSEIHLLLEGGAMIIPLTVRGCVSSLEFSDGAGNLLDPTALGVDYNDWVKVQVDFDGEKGRLYINDELAYSISYQFGQRKIVGIRYRFQGTGSVNNVKLSSKAGKEVYYEDFNY